MSKKFGIYGDKDVMKKIRKINAKQLDEGIREGMELGADLVKNEAKEIMTRNGSVFTGTTKRSIDRTNATEERGNYLVKVGSPQSDPPIALFVERGTAPHFPPVKEITPWAEKHGIDPWALAIHISKYGTKPHPFLHPALDNKEKDFSNEVAQGIKRRL